MARKDYGRVYSSSLDKPEGYQGTMWTVSDLTGHVGAWSLEELVLHDYDWDFLSML